MIQLWQNVFQTLLHRLRTARQVDDQRAFADPACLNIVRFVNCKLYARIASGIPGTIRSATASVASGITSREENPVPPVVKSRSAFPSSQISFIASSNIAWSSGSTFCQTTS